MPKTTIKMQTSFKNGLQSSHLARIIAQDQHHGSATERVVETVLNQLREIAGVKNLRQIDDAKIQIYIDTLRDRLEDGELSTGTTSDYISALNNVIRYANEYANQNLSLISAKEFDLSRGEREYINRAVSQETHQAFLNFLSEKGNMQTQALISSVVLQREFGLRLRESLAIKRESIEKALQKGSLTLSRQDGTKNAKERTIPVRNEAQVQALKSALNFMQANGLKSLIPSEKLLTQYHYAQYIKQEYNRLFTDNKMDFHGERYHYAQERYNEGASLKQISKELGHEREEITKVYLNIK